MKAPIDVVRAQVRALIEILLREREALKRRAFGQLAALLEEKNRRLASLEAAFADAAEFGPDPGISKSVEELRAKAEANAEILMRARQGMSDARRRLDALIAEEGKSGLYAAQGAAIGRPCSRIERNA